MDDNFNASCLVTQGLRSSSVVTDLAKGHTSFSVLYVDMIGFGRFEQTFGNAACEGVLEQFTEILQTRVQERFHDTKRWIVHVFDDGYAVVFADVTIDTRTTYQFIMQLEADLNQVLHEAGYLSLRLRYGQSSAALPSDSDVAVVLNRRITEAGRLARRMSSLPPAHIAKLFYQTLEAQDVHVRYQPIVQFSTQSTIGWEFLTRGPIGTELENPVRLFECADQLGHLFELERICRSAAIHGAKLPPGASLFINVNPKTLIDPKFHEGETRRLVDQFGLSPRQIVFEITEHQAIDDFGLFNRLIRHYRNQGFRIAIDDTGAGYSGLVTLMEVKPDIVKIDMGLIRDIHLDETKSNIVRAIAEVSRTFGAVVVAEGIESIEEFSAIKACGVDFGQGYLFGRPESIMMQANTIDS